MTDTTLHTNEIPQLHHHHHYLKKPSPVVDLISGGIAGTAVDLCLHPLDLVKVRLQVQEKNKYANMSHAFRTIVKEEGFFGLYKGLSAALSGTLPCVALYFFAYEKSKYFLFSKFCPEELAINHSLNEDDENKRSSIFSKKSLIYLVAGGLGDLASSTLYVPSDLVKQRMVLLKLQETGDAKTHLPLERLQNYKGPISGLKSIIQHEGITGLYRGFSTTMMRDIPFSALQFVFYENIKNFVLDVTNRDEIYTHEALVGGAISGSCSAMVTHPLDVIKTRLQISNSSISQVVKSIYEQKGVSGFYKGILPRSLWYTFSSSILFAVYEMCRKLLTVRFQSIPNEKVL